MQTNVCTHIYFEQYTLLRAINLLQLSGIYNGSGVQESINKGKRFIDEKGCTSFPVLSMIIEELGYAG